MSSHPRRSNVTRVERANRTFNRKPADATLAEKFRNVEKTLSVLLSSMSTGAAPDPAALKQLQASLAEGLAADSAANQAKSRPSNDVRSPSSGSDGPNKRPRRDDGPSPSANSPFNPTLNLSPATAPGSGRLPHLTLDGTPRMSDTSSLTSAPPSATGGGSSLAMLADASLAAQIDGRSTMKGLDPTFNLSRVTAALEERRGSGEEETSTPAILSKGIITPELAVDLFKLYVLRFCSECRTDHCDFGADSYFEWVYIHLPGLDPVFDSATSVCARSPFLFTVICGSSLHSQSFLQEADPPSEP